MDLGRCRRLLRIRRDECPGAGLAAFPERVVAMTFRTFLVPASFLLACFASGCGGSPKTNVEEHANAAELQQIPGSRLLHEWKKIYSIDVRGTERVRTLVGYLDHRSSEEDPEGKSFVLDRTHVVRGFILPSGRAYVFEGNDPASPRARDLGQTSLENSVKKILGAPGGLEFDLVQAATTRPADSAPASDRS
jgi:hypothetical protein